jgi:4-amino-4-deoxy-L-arabinose transferase-like glycosyltransferase
MGRAVVERGWHFWLVSGIFWLLLLTLLLTRSLMRPLDHDEHQFVTSGVLLARVGLLPYLDYAYFHVPLLVLVYAVLFQATDYFLLTARLFSSVCAWVLLITLFGVTLRLFRQQHRWTQFLLAAGSLLLFLATPLFLYTSGRAWNHDLPVLLAVLALLAHGEGLAQPARRWPVALSGLLLGLACVTRLSFVPMGLPLGLAIWLWPNAQTWRARFVTTVLFGLGLALGSSPAWPFFLAEPHSFLFGNLEYAELNTLYRESIGYERRMTLAAKLQSFVVEWLIYEPGNLLLLIGYLWLGRPRWRADPTVCAWLWLIAGVILAQTVGALTPTPSWPQYYYAIFPFLLLGLLYGLATVQSARLAQRWFRWLGSVTVIGVVALTARQYQHIGRVFQPAKWFPVELHQTAGAMSALAGPNPTLLTLAPIFPLEGRATIYPALATGPFALRAAQFLEPSEEQALHLVDGAALDRWLASQPPDAVLTNVHPNQAADEAVLVDYARRHAYAPVTFDDGEVLWLAPRAQWDGAFQLVGVAGLPTQVAAGATITPVFFLENLAPLTDNLTVNVRVVNGTGEVVAQSSGWPWGRPTSTWALHERWYDGHVLALPATLAPGIYRVELEFYAPDSDRLLPVTDLRGHSATGMVYGVDYFVVGDWPPPATTALAPTPIYSDSVSLLGYDLPRPPPLSGGDTLHLRLHWHALAPLRGDYTVFVHLVNRAGALVAQDDQPPLGGFYPTSRWAVGATVVDEYTLTLPDGLPAGVYTVQVGFYDLASGARLPVIARPPQSMWAVVWQRLFTGAATEDRPPAQSWPLTMVVLEE